MSKLSWWEKLRNYFEDFEQKYKFKFSYIRFGIVLFSFWLIHNYRADFKGKYVIPEPFNVFNHIGNVDSIIPALLLGFMIGFLISRSLSLSRKRLYWSGVLAGSITGLILNIMIETSVGMKLLNQYNTSDPLDVLWGTIFCFMACLISFTIMKIEKSKS